MRITKKALREQFSSTRLDKVVLSDILKDSKGYSGNFIERLKARLSDINHGCITGVVGKLIYHSDCLKFFIKFIDDISELIIDLEENIGLPLENKQGLPIYTFYVWLAYEETSYKIWNFIDEKSER